MSDDSTDAVSDPQTDTRRYEAQLAAILRVTIPRLSDWERTIQPVVSDTVDAMIADGAVSYGLAEAFDDLGQFHQRVGADLFAACRRSGLTMADGPDDRPRTRKKRRAASG